MAEPRQQLLLEPSFAEFVRSDSFVRLSAGAPIDPQALRVGLTREGPRIEVLRLWPRPTAWVRSEGEFWLPLDPHVWLRPGVQMHLPRHHARRWGPAASAVWVPPPSEIVLQVVPAEVLGVLDRLDPSLQFDALRLLDAAPQSCDLFEANPALAALLARSVPVELPSGFEEVADRLHGRRIDLLELVGLPPRRWVERALRSLDPAALDGDSLAGVVDLIVRADRGVHRLLQHIRPLSRPVVEALVDPIAMLAATPALLQEAATKSDEELAEALPAFADDASPLARALHELGWSALEAERASARPRSLGRLATLTRGAGAPPPWTPEAYGPFPEPCAGELSLLTCPRVRLRPLSDPAALHAHGTAQDNCIPDDPSFVAQATEGESAFFEATWGGAEGVAATATVHLTSHQGDWSIEEVAGARNAPAPPWLQDAIEAWTAGLGDAPLRDGDGDDLPRLRKPRQEPEQLTLPLRLRVSVYDAPSGGGCPSDES